MKKFFLFIIFYLSQFTNAQFLVEDAVEDEFFSENGKSMFSANLNFPFEYFRILNCTENQISYAKPVNGEEAVKRELFNYMQAYLDKDAYALNGTFYFVFDIDAQGNVSGFELRPNVVNSNMLREDMKFIVKRLKEKWYPANCGGAPIPSKMRMKVNFRTEFFDL